MGRDGAQERVGASRGHVGRPGECGLSVYGKERIGRVGALRL